MRLRERAAMPGGKQENRQSPTILLLDRAYGPSPIFRMLDDLDAQVYVRKGHRSGSDLKRKLRNARALSIISEWLAHVIAGYLV